MMLHRGGPVLDRARYTNDRSYRPSLDPSRSAEPHENRLTDPQAVELMLRLAYPSNPERDDRPKVRGH
jgi:hypothetical protein